MMGRDATVEGFDESSPLLASIAAREIGKALGTRFSSNERLDDGATALTQDIGQHAGYLEIGVLEHFLQPKRVLRHFSHQLLPRPGQIAELLNRSGRNETAANETVSQ